MINIKKMEQRGYCCEPLSNIEGYDDAITSEEQYCIHHRLGIELNKTREELKEMGLYFNRPASELMFIPFDEHTSIHKLGKLLSEEHRKKCGQAFLGRHHTDESKAKISINLSKRMKGVKKPKYKWMDSDGNIHIMNTSQAKQYHPDWTKIEEDV